MNEWQMLRQARYLLAAATWPGGGTTVFGDVLITDAPEEQAMQSHAFPLALIRPGEGQCDREEPESLAFTFDVRLLHRCAADGIGEAAILGACRSGGKLTSVGRGLVECQEPLFRALAKLTGTDGLDVFCRARSMVRVARLADPSYVAWRDYRFEGRCGSVDRYYPSPTRLSGAALGGGSVSLTWRLPPDRFDRYSLTLRRAAGAVPPATPAAGSGVPLAGLLSSSVVDSPGAGTWSYSLWAGYDESHEPLSVVEEYSDSDTLTVVVV